TVYSITHRDCRSCHGVSQVPLFAGDDPGQAYQASAALVDFHDIGRSPLVQRVEDGHCGTNCQTDGSAMSAAIRAWGKAEADFQSCQETAGPSPSPAPSVAPSPTPEPGSSPEPSPRPSPGGVPSFKRDVQPVLARKCDSCHWQFYSGYTQL